MIGFLLNLIPGMGILTGAISGAFEFLKPIFKVLGEFTAWFIKEIIWEGLKDILDNLATFLLVCMLLGGTYWYTLNYGHKRVAAEREITKLVLQVKDLKHKCGDRCRGK